MRCKLVEKSCSLSIWNLNDLQSTLIKFIFPALFEPFISITEKTGTLFFNQDINEKYEGEIKVPLRNLRKTGYMNYLRWILF